MSANVKKGGPVNSRNIILRPLLRRILGGSSASPGGTESRGVEAGEVAEVLNGGSFVDLTLGE